MYLHEVLDTWFGQAVRPRMSGRCFLIRYADDAVLGFGSKADAQRVMEVLPKRFGKFGLTLHPTKTRLVEFRPDESDHDDRNDPEQNPPRTFTFLGFTHYWGRSRKGKAVIKRKTAAKSLTRALKTIRQWCRHHRHDPVCEQHRQLTRKLQGHYGYYGITGNYHSLWLFFEQTKRAWRTWLSRRSQTAYVDWPKYDRLLSRYPLPKPKIIHSYYRR